MAIGLRWALAARLVHTQPWSEHPGDPAGASSVARGLFLRRMVGVNMLLEVRCEAHTLNCEWRAQVSIWFSKRCGSDTCVHVWKMICGQMGRRVESQSLDLGSPGALLDLNPFPVPGIPVGTALARRGRPAGVEGAGVVAR